MGSVGNGTRCSFRFFVPEDLHESEDASSSYYHYLFQIECELLGVDFRRDFSVPVFRSHTPKLSSSNAEYAKELSPLDKVLGGTVIISETAEALQFYYPWFRHLWIGIMIIIFSRIFGIIGYFIGISNARCHKS